MDKETIITEIARQKLVEEIVHNIGGNTDDDLQDLIQDLYIDLMNKPDTLIQSLYNNKQFNFYITKMVLNNVRSKNSPFFSTYKKPIILKAPEGLLDNIYDE